MELAVLTRRIASVAAAVVVLALWTDPASAQSAPGAQTSVGTPSVVGAVDLYDQARAAFTQDQLVRAYGLAERAAAAEPTRGDIQLLLGDIACARAEVSLASPMGRRCGAAYRRAVELSPDSLTYQEALAGWLELAPRSAGGGRDSALAVAVRMRARDEVRGVALEASILWHGGRVERRRADSLMSALGAAHAAERPVVLRVGDYWVETRRPDSALAVYARLADKDPDDAVAQYFLGRQMVRMKRDPTRALNHLLVAAMTVAAPPESVGGVSYTPGAPWWRMGQAYEQLGNVDSARICFEEALSLTPGMPEAQGSLDSLLRRRRR